MSDEHDDDYLDYLRLLEDAKYSLGELLRASEPGTAPSLHAAYNVLKRSIARHEASARTTEPVVAEANLGAALARVGSAFRESEEMRRRSELGDRWRLMKLDDRHRTILSVLGERKLTTREIVAALNDTAEWEFYNNDSVVVCTVRRLWQRGDLDRAAEEWRGKIRYRYFHRTELDGPIADLARAFEDEGAA
jgi:hypothetical protein